MTTVRLEPATPRSRVKHSTTALPVYPLFQHELDPYYTAFPFTDTSMLSHLDNTIPIPSTYSRQQPSTLGPRQLFDSDVTSPCAPFTDLFNCSSVHDKRMAQSWGRKLEAVNRRIVYISRQMTDMKQMMTFMMQKLSDISGTGNTYNTMEQVPSHSTRNTLKKTNNKSYERQAFRFMVGPGHCPMISKYGPSLSKAVDPSF